MDFWTVNPATEERIARYSPMGVKAVLGHVNKAWRAFGTWRELEIKERAKYLRGLAQNLKEHREEYAKMCVVEMGKPIRQSLSEIDKCAWATEVIADNGEKWLGEEPVGTDADHSVVRFEPLGVILGIMPWNFPFWQALRFAVPAVLAGNTALLRHSNVVPGSALLIEQAFIEAGFPDHVFTTVITDHATVESLVASDCVRGVSLTGSTEAGKQVAALAAKNLKKSVLELGGSDPLIVLEDADLEKAAQVGVGSRLINSGQSCINAKRFIIIDEVFEEFKGRFVKHMAGQVVGDPLDPKTDVGPLVREDQLRLIEAQVKDAVEKGAHVLLGGKRVKRKGYFFEPTVIDHVTEDMKVVAEEVFGPVAPLIKVKDEVEAINTANDSRFGLGAGLWTRDLERASRLVKKLEAGVVFVNGRVQSDPRMPFGGVKESGYGREISAYGIREFVNIKGVNLYKAA